MLRAISTRARNGWMLLALLPGAMLQARYDGASAFSNLVGALLFAAVIDTAVALLRKRSASLLRDQCVLLNAALVALWLPITLPLWAIASAVLAATLLACMFDGRQSGSPFHAAMVGCAFALLIVPHALAPPRNDTTPVWIATAYASAGIALVVGRCIRWQVPLGMLAGAGIIALSSRFVGGLQMHAIPIELLPVFALTTFFVATDASSGCAWPRARLLFGFGVGALAMLSILAFEDFGHALFGIAGAVLLMNASAPWLDRIMSDRTDQRRSPSLQRTNTINQ